MVQKVKKSKKKGASNPRTSPNATKLAASEQQPAKSLVEDEQDEQNWTPMQLEQIELSKKLDNYIAGFQKKLLRLNFQPSNRELVILFIMNYIRVGVVWWNLWNFLVRAGADAIFKTSEARALRDSGYFAPDDADLKLHTTESIAHLLNPEEDSNNSEKSDADNKLESSSSPTSTAATTATIATSTSTAATSSSATPPVTPLTADTPTDQKRNLGSPKKVIEENEGKSAGKEKAKSSPSVSPSISHSSTSESSQTLKPDVKDSTSAITPSTSSSSPSPTKAQMQAKVQQAIKIRKEKEKEKKTQSQMQQQMQQLEKMSTISPDQMGTLLTNIPKQHLDVNLTFLELPVNGKKVKGLLAKLSWGSSAISIDCAQRLGLKMKPSDHLCINTDFGYVDSVGILTLPIHHPADPTRAKSEMDIQVLPMIYGGKVDLVLGADFFCFFNPTLNIRTRAICFLEKETPYIVEKLVE
ncbi:hypothetical protein G6F42_019554 [Rhizopus arrhizus]|nr:hypothetical protein G6F42_019554 [Rhizopus arrhizus]